MEIIKPVVVADASTSPITSSGGTYWDRDGVLRAAVANTLRITYDPADLSAAPYPLIEGARSNLIPTPGSATVGWATNGGSFDFANYPDPMGGNRASRWTLANGQGEYIRVDGASTSADMVTGSIYTVSLFVKPIVGAGTLSIGLEAPLKRAIFDLSTMTVINESGTIDADALPLPGGWYRLFVSFVGDASGGKTVFAYSTYAGTMDFFVFGDQIESNYLSSYVEGTRAADVLTASSGLLYSNVVENDTDDGPLWSSVPAYAVGDKVRRPNHRTYYALQAGTNKTPEDNTSGATPYWQDLGPTKRFAVFDASYNTVSSAPDVVTYILRPGAVINGLAAVGLDASDIRVSMIDVSGAVVYSSTKLLRMKTSRSILEYCFNPIDRRTDEVFDDLPPFRSGVLCVTVTKTGSTAKIADLVYGRMEFIGDTQWQPEIRTLRRSVITDDGFGNVTFTKRRSSKLITADVALDNDRVDNTARVLNSYTDAPCAIIGDARWTSLIVIGFVQDFRLVLESPAGSMCNIQIQGFA